MDILGVGAFQILEQSRALRTQEVLESRGLLVLKRATPTLWTFPLRALLLEAGESGDIGIGANTALKLFFIYLFLFDS